jgi:hypothetical protein
MQKSTSNCVEREDSVTLTLELSISVLGLGSYSVMDLRDSLPQWDGLPGRNRLQLYGLVSSVFPKQTTMAHCLLNHRETREYERDGKSPDCREHRHLPAKLAEKKVLDGTHRWVGDENSRKCRIVPCEAKEWAKGTSENVEMMQMRRIFRNKRTAARRIGVPCGQQPRASLTQCRDVNHG